MPTKIKRQPRGPALPVLLPKSIQLTEDEKSSVAQWIRLRRNSRIWTSALVQALLDWDSSMVSDPSCKDVRELIDELEKIYGRLFAIQEGRSSNTRPPKSDHPAIVRFFINAVESTERAKERKTTWVVPDDEEEQFFQLLRQWRLTYPEPPKRTQQPSGHLGFEESGD